MIQKNSSEILLINKKLFDFIVKPHTHRAYPGERAALSLYNSNPPCQTGLVRQDGPHPHRQAGSALDGRADGESDGTSRGHLIQVAKHLYLQLALAQHIPLTGQVTRGGCQSRSVSIQGLVAVGGGVSGFVNVGHSQILCKVQ